MTETERIIKIVEFVEQIARFTDESEIEWGGHSEDSIDTLNGLIAEARKRTGIDPGHEKLFCIECQTPLDGCECVEDGQDSDQEGGVTEAK